MCACVCLNAAMRAHPHHLTAKGATTAASSWCPDSSSTLSPPTNLRPVRPARIAPSLGPSCPILPQTRLRSTLPNCALARLSLSSKGLRKIHRRRWGGGIPSRSPLCHSFLGRFFREAEWPTPLSPGCGHMRELECGVPSVLAKCSSFSRGALPRSWSVFEDCGLGNLVPCL